MGKGRERALIVSRCCKGEVSVANDDYFVCDVCGVPCDTIFALSLETNSHDDTGTVC
jgi:hypothetical protein